MAGRRSQLSGRHGSLDPGQYTSLALTHVQYHPGDPLSMPLSLITLAPPFLLVAYITLLLVRRELTILTSFVGQLACEGLNLGLKRIFKHGRPTDFLGTGYGMPSSHSQFMGYFMAFWCLHLYRFRPGLTRAREARRRGESSPMSLVGVLRSAEHMAIIAFIILLSLTTAYSRYHLSYHSPLQIVVGFSVGIAVGLGWYYFFQIVLDRPVLGMSASFRQMALDNPLLIALRIRDSWAVWDDGGIEGEYGLWRREWERRKAVLEVDGGGVVSDEAHLTRLLQALQLASKCEGTTAAFSVGCVITVTSTGEVLSTGYSRQEPGNTHAEEVALANLMHGEPALPSSPSLHLDLYTTMEPCSERLSKKAPCVQRMLDFNKAAYTFQGKAMEIVRIFQGVQEPEDFVKCVGTLRLESEGFQVATVQGPREMLNGQTGERLTVDAGWIEREAIRLAKKGHPDQPDSKGDEERLWRESGWMPAGISRHPPPAQSALRRRGARQR